VFCKGVIVYREIAIGVAGVGVLGLSLGLGSAALASTSSSVPGKTSAQLAQARAGAFASAPHGLPLTEPLGVNPPVVAAGGSVTVKGAHCNPGTLVFLYLGVADKSRDLGTVTADAQGVFTGTVRIPAGTPAGPDTLWAGCKAPNPTGKLLHIATIKITG
jgi:hypothetical protein